MVHVWLRFHLRVRKQACLRIPESPVLEIGLSKIKNLAGPLPGSGLLCPLNLGFLGAPDGFWNRSNFAVVAGGGGGRGCSSPAGCRPQQASPGYPCSVVPRYVAVHHYHLSRRRFIPDIPVSSSPRPPRPCHPKLPCPQLPATVTPALAPDATSAGPPFTWGQTRLVATSRPGPCLPSRLSQRRPQPSQARCGAGCLGGTGGGGHAARSGGGEGARRRRRRRRQRQRRRWRRRRQRRALRGAEPRGAAAEEEREEDAEHAGGCGPGRSEARRAQGAGSGRHLPRAPRLRWRRRGRGARSPRGRAARVRAEKPCGPGELTRRSAGPGTAYGER